MSYGGFAGKRLALVESMLYDAFYSGIHAAQRHGLEVWLLIGDREWYGSEAAWVDHPLARVDRLIMTDTSDPDAVAAEVTDAEGRPVIDGVMTFSDYHTETAAAVAERLGLPGPGPRPFATANRKDLMRQALAAKPYNVDHVLVTAKDELADAARRIGFPLVAKPPAEAISYGVRRVDDFPALEAAYAELAAIRHSLRGQPRPGHVLLEPYVTGPEVSVESLTVDGTTHFYGITAKHLGDPPTFLEEAHAFPAELGRDESDALRAAVADALATIGYTQGPAHTEVKLTPDGPRLVEINPRLPSANITKIIADLGGRNPHLDAKLLAVGGRPEPPSPPDRGGGAVVVVYPPRRSGTFLGIDGIDAAVELPGVAVEVLGHPGDELWHRVDNSGRVALVSARAGDAGAALALAREAAARLTVRIGEQGQ